jgi:hypothetical protein
VCGLSPENFDEADEELAEEVFSTTPFKKHLTNPTFSAIV